MIGKDLEIGRANLRAEAETQASAPEEPHVALVHRNVRR
jgi:hypothetical protein